MTTKRTIKNRRKKLIEALRSGKYKKITGKLIKYNCNGDPVGYCVLGVATDIYNKSVPKIDKTELSESDGDIDICVNEYYGGLYSDRIITDNDCKKLSFNKIADKMEKHPENYFEGVDNEI